MIPPEKFVLLIAHNAIMLDYVMPIHELLKEHTGIGVWFCVPQPPEGTNIPCLPYSVARERQWDLVIYPDHAPPFPNARARIYTGHSLHSGKQISEEPYNYGPLSRGLDGKILYDKFFVPSQYAAEYVKRVAPAYAPRTRVVGNLMVDRMLSETRDRERILNDLKLPTDRKTVLLTSTWRADSLAQIYGARLMEYCTPLLDQFNVVVSVHGNNFLPEFSPETDWNHLYTYFQDHRQHPNIRLIGKRETSIAFLPAIDLLITDHTAASLFFALLKRPIITHIPDDTTFWSGSLFHELIDTSVRLDRITDIRPTVDKALNSHRPEHWDRLSKQICAFQGHARRKHLEEIMDSLGLQITPETADGVSAKP